MNDKKLRRSATNQVIAGVCGGFGEYFEVDPTIVRIIFVIMALASGSGIFIYILLWLLIPGPTSNSNTGEGTIKEGFKEMEAKFDEVTHSVKEKVDGEKQTVSEPAEHSPKQESVKNHEPHFWLGVILILLGGYFFLNNYGFFRLLDIGELWPVILIAFGAYYLFKKN